MYKYGEELISIVVPIYKVEEYMKQCVDSLIKQTYKNIEIILVDDGSPDNCGEICEKYREIDSRIVVIHKKNGGLSDARNYGIKVCKGEYLVFVDSDDYVADNYIEVLYDALKKENADISVAELKKFFDNEDVVIHEIENIEISSYNSKDVMGLYFTDKAIVMTTAWGKMYKCSLFDKISFPKGRLHEDEFTTYKLMDKADRIAYTNLPVYFYRQREESIVNCTYNIKRLDILDAFYERLCFFKRKLFGTIISC